MGGGLFHFSFSFVCLSCLGADDGSLRRSERTCGLDGKERGRERVTDARGEKISLCQLPIPTGRYSSVESKYSVYMYKSRKKGAFYG